MQMKRVKYHEWLADNLAAEIFANSICPDHILTARILADYSGPMRFLAGISRSTVINAGNHSTVLPVNALAFAGPVVLDTSVPGRGMERLDFPAVSCSAKSDYLVI